MFGARSDVCGAEVVRCACQATFCGNHTFTCIECGRFTCLRHRYSAVCPECRRGVTALPVKVETTRSRRSARPWCAPIAAAGGIRRGRGSRELERERAQEFVVEERAQSRDAFRRWAAVVGSVDKEGADAVRFQGGDVEVVAVADHERPSAVDAACGEPCCDAFAFVPIDEHVVEAEAESEVV
jgi:hypothetical protein